MKTNSPSPHGNRKTKATAKRLHRASKQLHPLFHESHRITTRHLDTAMDNTWNTRTGERSWHEHDAQEVLEATFNHHLLETGYRTYSNSHHPEIDLLLETMRLEELMPPRKQRSREQRMHQFFSTPPQIAIAMAVAAHPAPHDHILEPSAGLGILAAAIASIQPAAPLHINEIEPVRHAVLRKLFPSSNHTAQDAAELPRTSLRNYDVIIMNPPFSIRATTGKRRANEDIHHLHSASRVLRPKGRIVALTSSTATPSSPAWQRIMHDVPDITVIYSKTLAATVFHKRGLSIETRITVIERNSDYTFRPWTPRHDEQFTTPQELLNSILTELPAKSPLATGATV